LVKISPTHSNLPQTFEPCLRSNCSSLSSMGHPETRTKLHLGKGIPNEANVCRQHERLVHRLQIKLTTYILSFLTSLSYHRKCALSLLNSPSATPLPFTDLFTGMTTPLFNLLQASSSIQLISYQGTCMGTNTCTGMGMGMAMGTIIVTKRHKGHKKKIMFL
jgi:hypothetical protein